LSALHIERALGVTRERNFYDFDGSAVRMLQRLDKPPSGTREQQLAFLGKYFGEEEYAYDPVAFTLLDRGIVDSDEVRRSRAPTPLATTYDRLMQRLRSAEWQWATDEQVAHLANEVLDCLAVERGISAVQLIQGLAYARLLAEVSGASLDQQHQADIQQRVVELARTGDVIDDHAPGPLFLADFRKYIEDEWDTFTREREAYEQAKAAVAVESHVGAGTLADLARLIANTSIDGEVPILKALTVERLFRARKRDPEGFVLLVGVTLERLGYAAAAQLMPDALDRRSEIMAELQRVRGDPNESHMDRWRAAQASRTRG
jgi:hypothetical protein